MLKLLGVSHRVRTVTTSYTKDERHVQKKTNEEPTTSYCRFQLPLLANTTGKTSMNRYTRSRSTVTNPDDNVRTDTAECACHTTLRRLTCYLHVDRVAIQPVHGVVEVFPVVPSVLDIFDHPAHIRILVRQVTCRRNSPVHLCVWKMTIKRTVI